MKVAVIGPNGQLGSDLVEVFTNNCHEVSELNHDIISVERYDSVVACLTTIKPAVILNTAAYHNVRKCEENPETAFAVNALGAFNVARVAAELNAVNVFFSTDYVFDGAKRAPYVETDLPNPLNVYAISKLAAEYLTMDYSPKSYVIRVSGLYGRIPCRAKGDNFITTMVRLAQARPEVRVVQDEFLTPTPTLEIAQKTSRLLETGAYGLYHLTCEGSCSWYEFAREIFSTLNLATPLYPVNGTEFPQVVKRPTYSVLANERFNSLEIGQMPHWAEALRTFLSKVC
jgi:dTDP-4-dehydrorhamnose reductase